MEEILLIAKDVGLDVNIETYQIFEEKAKELGLNLSQITEQALELTTLSNEKEIVTQKELRIAYKEIFHLLLKVLEEWGTSIEIGSYLDFIDKQETDLQEFSYNLNSHGIYRWNPFA